MSYGITFRCADEAAATAVVVGLRAGQLHGKRIPRGTTWEQDGEYLRISTPKDSDWKRLTPSSKTGMIKCGRGPNVVDGGPESPDAARLRALQNAAAGR